MPLEINVEESFYVDYANEVSDYTNESWYKNAMSIYSSQKESESF